VLDFGRFFFELAEELAGVDADGPACGDGSGWECHDV